MLERVGQGALVLADARFGPGLHVVVGDAAAALSTLVNLVAGTSSPRRGRVLCDGKNPHASPEARAGIAALLATETLPMATTVAAAVERVLLARGQAPSPTALLAEQGLEAWARRRPADLDAAERRRVALALALAHPRPAVMALFEPFQANGAASSEPLRAALLGRAAGGAVVLVATTNPTALRAVPAARLSLQGGTLVPARPEALLAPGLASLRVQSDAPQRLVHALSADESVSGVHWHEGAEPGVVVAFGPELEALAASVARAAETSGASLERLFPATAPRPPAPGAPPPAAAQAMAPGAPPLPWPSTPSGAPPAAPDATSSRAPDQSVRMPTSFADPTRPSGENGDR